MVHPHNGILFDHNKRSTDECYKNEPQKNMMLNDGRATEGYILYDSTHIKDQKRPIHRDAKQISGRQGLG